MTTKSQPFTSNGTFTAPAGVSAVWVSGVAAGAGGGGGNVGFVGGGGGGGAGESCRNVLVDATSPIAIVLGVGGAKGPSSTAGSDGGDTTIGTIRLNGGYGGQGQGNGNGGNGGGSDARYDPGFVTNAGNRGIRTSGTGSNGVNGHRKNSVRYWTGAGGGAGSNLASPIAGGHGGTCGPNAGGAGGAASTTNGAGGGGSSPYGVGGTGGNGAVASVGASATSYGCGGGGGGGGAGVLRAASDGIGGYALITWIEP